MHRKVVDNFIVFNVNVEKGLSDLFLLFYCLFAINKLRRSTYLCTPSGNPFGLSLFILPLFFYPQNALF